MNQDRVTLKGHSKHPNMTRNALLVAFYSGVGFLAFRVTDRKLKILHNVFYFVLGIRGIFMSNGKAFMF